MRAGGPSGGADLRDLLPDRNRLPHADIERAAMRIEGLDSAAVVNDDIFTVAISGGNCGVRHLDSAGCRGKNRGAVSAAARDIDTGMEVASAEP